MLELLLIFTAVPSCSTVLVCQEISVKQDERIENELEYEELLSPAGPNSALPNLTRGADGQVYFSWIEREGDDKGVMRFSVLEPDGWGAPLEVFRGNDLFLNWADFPSVSALESGVLIAHWLRRTEGPHGYSAEFSISSDHGHEWSAAKTLHDDIAPAEHGFVSIAPLDDGTFGAIWLDGRRTVGKDHGEGDMALYFRTISATGALGPEAVLDDRVCSCCQTSLVVTPGGQLVAVYRDRTPEEVRDISIVRFDGQRWSKPAPVHADGWVIAGCPVNGPRVFSTRDTTATAWFTGAGEGGGNVLVAFENGAGSGFAVPLDVDEGRPIGRVDVLSIEADSVLVSWLEYAELSGAEWRVRRVWKDGRSEPSIFVGTVPFDRASGFLRMAIAGSDAVLAWTTRDPESRVETARIRVAK